MLLFCKSTALAEVVSTTLACCSGAEFTPGCSSFIDQGFPTRVFAPSDELFCSGGLFFEIMKFKRNMVFSQPIQCFLDGATIFYTVNLLCRIVICHGLKLSLLNEKNEVLLIFL